MSRSQRQRRKPTAAASRAAALPFWKKVLFGLGTCAFLLAATEGLLALVGVRVASYQPDPYVGFARNVPHFVPDPTAPDSGVLVTAENKRRILNQQRFNARKPPNTYRIFCLGGSTTYGHPYTDSTSFCGWLREMLPKADPSRSWELINAGGISYASYREALLMEELVRYQPDLFIVLSAHNEFLEQRSYGQIIAMPESLRGLGALLSQTRLYTAMKTGLDRARPGPPPAAASTNATQLPENPEAILDRTVGPQSYHRDDIQQTKIIDHYRFNLARMVTIARSAGAKVIFINPASNLRDCAPFKSEHRTGLTPAELARWNSLRRSASLARQAGRLDEALQQLDEAITLDPRFAESHFQRGQVLAALKRPAPALEAFERARDEDVCPLRALGPMLAATVEVARQQGAPIVDFVRLMKSQAAQGIPGEDWFLDHVHPTIEGHRQLALEIMGVMRKESLLRFAPSWTEAAQRDVKRTVEARVTDREQANALVTLAKLLFWAGKNDEGYRAANRAEALAPNDPVILFEVGKGASRAGRSSEAIRALRKAVELNPRFVEARSLLGLQLLDAGQTAEAIEHGRAAVELRPNDPQARLNLGAMLERAGQMTEAEAVYRQVIQIAPGYAEAHNNLGWLQKERGASTEALASFREAVQLRPGSTIPTLGLAWMLATHPDPAQRDPATAIRLSEQLVAQSGHQNWMSLDTLAVAYAAAGRFPDATQTATRALEQLRASRRPEATNVAARLALFQKNQPFIEPGSPTSQSARR